MITNSISFLQEHCVQNGLPVPTYHFEDLTQPSTPSKFACHCKMGHISAVATASSKKESKHEAAKMILQKIGIHGAKNKTNLVPKKPEPNPSLILDNPIGKLNEYCSKNRYTYPSYFEMGVRNGEFVVQCKHQSFVTEGLANNKKTAKQLAAHNMLAALNKAPALRLQSPTTSKSEYNKPPDVIDRPEKQFSDEDIIRLYHEIIKKRESAQKVEPSYTITDPFSPEVNHNEVEDIKKEEKPDVVSQDDFENLEKQFKDLKLDYSISVVSKEPLIMSMQVSDATFMDMGSSSEECMSKLFKTALNKYKET